MLLHIEFNQTCQVSLHSGLKPDRFSLSSGSCVTDVRDVRNFQEKDRMLAIALRGCWQEGWYIERK